MKKNSLYLFLLIGSVLIACGGGELAVIATLGYIAPIGGDFNEDGDVDTPALEATGHAVNIQIGEGWNQFFDSEFEVTGTTDLEQYAAVCPEFTGEVSERNFTAFTQVDPSTVCFQGEFENESVLVLDDGTRLLRDFPIDLRTGVWVNINDENQLFKLEEDLGNNTIGGCEIVSGAVSPVVGSFVQSDVASGIIASIDSFTIQHDDEDLSFTGNFQGVSGIKLTNGETELLLERRDQTASCE
jgi:hypothetical protein